MVTNDTLFALATEQRIKVTLAPLPKRINGFYYLSPDNRPSIALNRDLKEGSTKYRSVLAEELGHHFTSSGPAALMEGMAYYERVQHDRIESRAVRWAADFLIPTEQLLCTVEDCSVSCLQELADTFQVTVELLLCKLEHMACQALYWPLSDGRSLCLASLPSVYIYDPFTYGVP